MKSLFWVTLCTLFQLTKQDGELACREASAVACNMCTHILLNEFPFTINSSPFSPTSAKSLCEKEFASGLTNTQLIDSLVEECAYFVSFFVNPPPSLSFTSQPSALFSRVSPEESSIVKSHFIKEKRQDAALKRLITHLKSQPFALSSHFEVECRVQGCCPSLTSEEVGEEPVNSIPQIPDTSSQAEEQKPEVGIDGESLLHLESHMIEKGFRRSYFSPGLFFESLLLSPRVSRSLRPTSIARPTLSQIETREIEHDNLERPRRACETRGEKSSLFTKASCDICRSAASKKAHLLSVQTMELQQICNAFITNFQSMSSTEEFQIKSEFYNFYHQKLQLEQKLEEEEIKEWAAFTPLSSVLLNLCQTITFQMFPTFPQQAPMHPDSSLDQEIQMEKEGPEEEHLFTLYFQSMEEVLRRQPLAIQQRALRDIDTFLRISRHQDLESNRTELGEEELLVWDYCYHERCCGEEDFEKEYPEFSYLFSCFGSDFYEEAAKDLRSASINRAQTRATTSKIIDQTLIRSDESFPTNREDPMEEFIAAEIDNLMLLPLFPVSLNPRNEYANIIRTLAERDLVLFHLKKEFASLAFFLVMSLRLEIPLQSISISPQAMEFFFLPLLRSCPARRSEVESILSLMSPSPPISSLSSLPSSLVKYNFPFMRIELLLETLSCGSSENGEKIHQFFWNQIHLASKFYFHHCEKCTDSSKIQPNLQRWDDFLRENYFYGETRLSLHQFFVQNDMGLSNFDIEIFTTFSRLFYQIFTSAFPILSKKYYLLSSKSLQYNFELQNKFKQAIHPLLVSRVNEFYENHPNLARARPEPSELEMDEMYNKFSSDVSDLSLWLQFGFLSPDAKIVKNYARSRRFSSLGDNYDMHQFLMVLNKELESLNPLIDSNIANAFSQSVTENFKRHIAKQQEILENFEVEEYQSHTMLYREMHGGERGRRDGVERRRRDRGRQRDAEELLSSAETQSIVEWTQKKFDEYGGSALELDGDRVKERADKNWNKFLMEIENFDVIKKKFCIAKQEHQNLRNLMNEIFTRLQANLQMLKANCSQALNFDESVCSQLCDDMFAETATELKEREALRRDEEDIIEKEWVDKANRAKPVSVDDEGERIIKEEVVEKRKKPWYSKLGKVIRSINFTKKIKSKKAAHQKCYKICTASWSSSSYDKKKYDALFDLSGLDLKNLMTPSKTSASCSGEDQCEIATYLSYISSHSSSSLISFLNATVEGQFAVLQRAWAGEKLLLQVGNTSQNGGNDRSSSFEASLQNRIRNTCVALSNDAQLKLFPSKLQFGIAPPVLISSPSAESLDASGRGRKGVFWSPSLFPPANYALKHFSLINGREENCLSWFLSFENQKNFFCATNIDEIGKARKMELFDALHEKAEKLMNHQSKMETLWVHQKRMLRLYYKLLTGKFSATLPGDRRLGRVERTREGREERGRDEDEDEGQAKISSVEQIENHLEQFDFLRNLFRTKILPARETSLFLLQSHYLFYHQKFFPSKKFLTKISANKHIPSIQTYFSKIHEFLTGKKLVEKLSSKAGEAVRHEQISEEEYLMKLRRGIFDEEFLNENEKETENIMRLLLFTASFFDAPENDKFIKKLNKIIKKSKIFEDDCPLSSQQYSSFLYMPFMSDVF